MKKTLILLFLIVFVPLNVYADTENSLVVMDVESGRILYQKKMNKKNLIASTTKIMTCIVVLENSNIESLITVGDEVSSMYGTNIYIEKGEILRVKDLLYGLMLRSGNDAAVTLAYNTLGYETFINKMNEKAKELGMNNTIFSNPHGLDDETKNYSTAYDMALLSKYAYNNATYRQIISTKKYSTKSSIKSYVWYNRMALLNNYKNCIGGKNGYTPKAGKSLVSYAKNGDLILTIISLDDDSIYENHKSIYKEYFDKYKNYIIVEKGNFTFEGSTYYVNESFKYPLTYDETNDITTLVKINQKSHDKNVGKIEIYFNKNIIGSVNIYKYENKKPESKSFLWKILNLFSRNSIKTN